MADADLVVVMLDASDEITDDDRQILESISNIEHVIALNKIDKATDQNTVVFAAH